MAHKKITLVFKGGDGSGHFDHAGRPGKHGGSLPGKKGSGAVSAKKTSVDDPEKWISSKLKYSVDYNTIVDHYTNTGLSGNLADFAADAYEYTDRETGYTTEVTTFRYGSINDQIIVNGDVKDADGKYIGNFVRMINADGTIYHDSFDMVVEVQSKGFGSRFYKHAEDAYVAAGVKQVSLHAGNTVGGYAWARVGYNFAQDVDRRSIAQVFSTEAADRYGGDEEDYMDMFRLLPAWEMAAWTGPDGYRLGKDVMLGSDWMAVKNLDTDDRGYQVGQMYYALK